MFLRLMCGDAGGDADDGGTWGCIRQDGRTATHVGVLIDVDGAEESRAGTEAPAAFHPISALVDQADQTEAEIAIDEDCATSVLALEAGPQNWAVAGGGGAQESEGKGKQAVHSTISGVEGGDRSDLRAAPCLFNLCLG